MPPQGLPAIRDYPYKRSPWVALRTHRPRSGDETRRRLSAFMRAAAGVVQPVPGLLVGPARNREVRRRGGNRLAGTDGNMPMRARRRFEAMHRRGVGGSTQSDQ